MHLEKIEISGFKSFADKTVLRFDQPITAIVGPNGCGKSNIVDAFRWVLGEGSAKSLRSDKMVDVIFSGSSKRKPLNFAQISLTFTQIKKTLTFNYEELCITRRIHRSGESEWYVNKKPVRLKDVYTLLWEAGMGKNAFYIFEQGKVDHLITSSPLERRCIFEEAAKIMHFKEKKKEALRKLSHVEENLKRVLDIQSEVTKQIETLQKQAEEARIYSEKKEHLDFLEEGLLVYKWKHNHKKQLQEKEASANNAEKQKGVKLNILKLEESLKALKNKQSLKAMETRQAYESFFEIKKGKEVASFEFSTHQKHQKDLERQTKGLKNSLQTLHQKHLKEHRTFEENQKDLKEHEKGALSLSSNLEKINQNLSSLEQKVDQESTLRKKAQQELMLVVHSANELQTQYKSNTSQLHNYKERLAKLLHDEKKDLVQIKEREAEQKKCTESLALYQKESSQDQDRIKTLQSDYENLVKKLELLKEKQKELLARRTENKATIDLLVSLKSELEGFNQSSKTLLQFAQDQTHPLFEKVFQLTNWFQPKKGYETQLSTILQPYLETLVVHTNQDLGLLIEIAKKEGLKNFSCLSLENISPKTSPIELAEENQVSSHFLKEIKCKEGMSPNQISEDDFCDHLGVYHRVSTEEQNHFLREVELKKREKKQTAFDHDYDLISQEIQKIQEKNRAHQKELQGLRQKMHQHELTQNKAQYALQNCEKDLEYLRKKTSTGTPKKEELSLQIQDLEVQQKKLIKSCDHEDKKKTHQESLFSKIEAEFESNFGELKEKRGLKESLQDRIKGFEKKAQSLRESIRVFESKSANFENQVQEISSAIEQKERDFKVSLQKNDAFEKKQNEFGSKLKVSEDKYRALEANLEQLEKEEKEEERKLIEERTQLEQDRTLELEIKTRLSKIDTEIHLQTEEIVEKLGIKKEEILQIDVGPSISLGKTEREIKRLKKELESQPEVNLKAISECEKQQSRFEFLQSQVKDLEESQAKFLEIITKLDETSREKFEKTFEQIRTRFKENFLLLFNGGEADLKLTSAQDILDAGIDIIAQPPGKKMRSIQLLSGGEKCLCAIALLFALFETQSIPFCILDEIDAPLDDTNIERFTNVLKQFVKNNQFIIITHNKRTMAIADHLLGVSMQEKGVTKILPLEFNSNAAAAASV